MFKEIVLTMMLLSVLAVADDGQLYISCGGDSQLIIGCFGDEQNFPLGSFVPAATFCGDGTCQSGESCGVCAVDCGTCAPSSSGSSGGVTKSFFAPKIDRRFEYSFKVSSESEEDVIFNLVGEKLIRTGQGYGLRILPTDTKGSAVKLDVSPKITILNGLYQPILRDAEFRYEFVDGYVFNLPADTFLASGIYTSFVTVTVNGRSRVIAEEFEVRLSKDRLVLSKGSEVAPIVSCNLVISNEGDVSDDFRVRYWVTTSEDGKFEEASQATMLTKSLVSSGKSEDACAIKEIECGSCLDKICSRISDELKFEVPLEITGPVNYWCKVETCRGYAGTPSSEDPCPGGIMSQASKLLAVRGLGMKPIDEVPSKVTFVDFVFGEGRKWSPRHPYLATFLVLAVVLFVHFAVYSFGSGQRQKTEEKIKSFKPKGVRLRL